MPVRPPNVLRVSPLAIFITSYHERIDADSVLAGRRKSEAAKVSRAKSEGRARISSERRVASVGQLKRSCEDKAAAILENY